MNQAGRALMLAALFITGCNSGSGPSSTRSGSDDARAIANAGCAFEDVQFCQHMIEKREILTQFFSPDASKKVSEEEKKRARRILTEEVVNAAATIQQCSKVTDESLTLINRMRIKRTDYNLMATAPVGPSSRCYIEPSKDEADG